MRMSPKNWSSAFCLIFSSSDFFALFSNPEYVWTTYHFLSIFSPSLPAIARLSLQNGVLDLVGDELPQHVEEPEQHRGDDAGDDHGDRRRLRFRQARPAHLAQLGHDFQRHLAR